MTKTFLADTLLACALATAAIAATAQPASEPSSAPAPAATGAERTAPGTFAASGAGPRASAPAAADAASAERKARLDASAAGRPALALALPATPPPAVRAAAGASSPAAARPAPADAAAAPGSGSITFVGTATVILRLGSYTILTDPNFLHKGEHAHLGYGLSTPRLTDPAMPIEQLPPIDLVLLSHYHGDHFDQVVERQLNRAVPIVTTPEAAAALRKRGFTAAQGLAQWQSIEVTKPLSAGGNAAAAGATSGAAAQAVSRLTITAMPGRHGPPVVARALPQTMGSLLEFAASSPGGTPWRLYISGDTLMFDELREIPQRYPGIDLALLHLGGTRVLGMLVTMDAEQGVRLLQLVQPATAIPIHYDDYPVFKSPLSDFRRAVEQAGLADRVKYLQRGETYRFAVGARR